MAGYNREHPSPEGLSPRGKDPLGLVVLKFLYFIYKIKETI